MQYLVESALLVHGIKNVSEETILRYWDLPDAPFVWMEKGMVRIGGIDKLMDFRRRMRESGIIPRRANHFNLDEYMSLGADAVMTASGAMSVCAIEGFGAAVTAGTGGFFPEILADNGTHLTTRGFGPPDVATLTQVPVVLVSSGPKDMLDYAGTIRYLDEHSVFVCGTKRPSYSGYVFVGEEAQLPHMLEEHQGTPPNWSRLHAAFVINEIDADKRLTDRSILEEAVAYGHEAEKAGGYFHPAVNEKLEELTKGYSALLQLAGLLDNAKLIRGIKEV